MTEYSCFPKVDERCSEDDEWFSEVNGSCSEVHGCTPEDDEYTPETNDSALANIQAREAALTHKEQTLILQQEILTKRQRDMDTTLLAGQQRVQKLMIGLENCFGDDSRSLNKYCEKRFDKLESRVYRVQDEVLQLHEVVAEGSHRRSGCSAKPVLRGSIFPTGKPAVKSTIFPTPRVTTKTVVVVLVLAVVVLLIMMSRMAKHIDVIYALHTDTVVACRTMIQDARELLEWATALSKTLKGPTQD